MFRPRRVFGIPILDELIIALVETLGVVAFVIIMVPVTLVILVLSFLLVMAATIPLSYGLEAIGVPRDVFSAPLGIAAIVGGLGLTFVLTVKAAKRLPVLGKAVMTESRDESSDDPEGPAASPAPRRTRPEVLAEVAELDARLAPRAGDHGD